MIIALLGKSCSGKTTLAKRLKLFGINQIPIYTTRPKRINEKEGLEYIFVNKEKFISLIDDDFFIETSSYQINESTEWYYGIPKKSLEASGIIIMNPFAYKYIKELYRDKIFGIYLKVSKESLINRLHKRGDELSECERRLKADDDDFENFDEEVDLIINNDKLNVKFVETIILSICNLLMLNPSKLFKD